MPQCTLPEHLAISQARINKAKRGEPLQPNIKVAQKLRLYTQQANIERGFSNPSAHIAMTLSNVTREWHLVRMHRRRIGRI
jgi:hypothetical protein